MSPLLVVSLIVEGKVTTDSERPAHTTTVTAVSSSLYAQGDGQSLCTRSDGQSVTLYTW